MSVAPVPGREQAPARESSVPAPSEGTPRRWHDRVRFGRVDVWFPTFVVVSVLLLSAFGISGSSLGTWSPSGAPDASTILFGKTRFVRSDEYQVTSPIKIGRVRAGFPSTTSFGMGELDVGRSWNQWLPNRSLPAVLYGPFNLPFVILPVTQAFALYWWLPFAACALGIYAWLRLLRVDSWIALAASLLTTTAPAAVWWSGWVPHALALAVAPAALVLLATRVWSRRPRLGVLVALGAGLSAAALPWWYQPWVIPAGLFIGTVTLLAGLGDPTRRRVFVKVVLVAGAVFAVETVVYLLHERAYYEAIADTVYPGERRERGGGMSIGKLFSSLFAFELAGEPGNSLVQDNVSEVAMGWTIALPFALGALALGWRAVRRDAQRALLVGTALMSVVLTSWCLVRWPAPLTRVTLLNFVQPSRMAPFVGFFGTVCAALLVANAERRSRLRAAIGRAGPFVLGAIVLVIAIKATTDFRDAYLPLSTKHVAVVVVATTALTLALCSRYWRVALVAATALGVVSGLLVNPLIQGLGAITESRAAAAVARIDERVVQPRHGTWATDTQAANALVNAAGASSLTSYNDPVDRAGWKTLDPTGQGEQAWNRLARIIFEWKPGAGAPFVGLPAADLVGVALDPCDPSLDRLRLTAVVSSFELDAPCLTELTRFPWHGVRTIVYRRAPVT